MHPSYNTATNEKFAIASHKQDNILQKCTEIVRNTTWRIITPKTNTKSVIKFT